MPYEPRPDPQRIICKGRWKGSTCGRVIAVNIVASAPDAGVFCFRCGHCNPVPYRPEVTKVPARV